MSDSLSFPVKKVLKDSYEQFKNGNKGDLGKFVFCLGNQACDLDSMTSSIAASFLNTNNQELLWGENKILIPIISCKRNEFRLRGDARLAFKTAGWTLSKDDHAPEELLFFDDFIQILQNKYRNRGYEEEGGNVKNHDINLILVDHNKLASSEASLLTPYQILGIYDHHHCQADEVDKIPENVRIIDTSFGSASSIVARELLRWKSENILMNHLIGSLIFSTILIDTQDLNPKLQRYNATDSEILNRLSKEFTPSDSVDRKAWFTSLMDARYDTTGLPVFDLFGMDYKDSVFERNKGDNNKSSIFKIGLSILFDTFPNVLTRSLGPEKLNEIGTSFAKDRNADLVIAVTSVNPLDQTRGIAFFSNTKHGENMALYLNQHLGNFHEMSLSMIPNEMKSSAVFQTQEIFEKGFGFVPVNDNSEWRCILGSTIRGSITRKTLMPAIMFLLSKW